MISLKGANEAPTSGSTRRTMRELGMAYPARAVRSRSLDSTRGSDAPPGRTRKPSTGGSQAGVFDTQSKGGTRDARGQSRPGYHPRTRQTRIASRRPVSTVVQPSFVPQSLWENLPQRRSDDQRRNDGN